MLDRLTLLACCLAPLLLGGCPGRPDLVAPDAAALAALDSSLAAWQPLEGLGPVKLQSAWNDGQAVPLLFRRELEGWERLDGGAPCARLVVLLEHPKRREAYLTEWLRPAGDRILCVRRRVGGADLELDPPQPMLVAPVASGTTWSWTGTVGGVPATSTFRVAALEPRHASEPGAPAPGAAEDRLRVEQTTTIDGLEASSVRWYARGRGVVEEQGPFPVGEPGRPVDRMRARVLEPTPGP